MQTTPSPLPRGEPKPDRFACYRASANIAIALPALLQTRSDIGDPFDLDDLTRTRVADTKRSDKAMNDKTPRIAEGLNSRIASRRTPVPRWAPYSLSRMYLRTASPTW